MSTVVDTLITVMQVDGLGPWSQAFGRAESILMQFGGALDAAGKRSLLLSAGAAAGAGLLAGGIAKAVQEAGNLQQISVGFETVFGSADAAQTKIRELQVFAAKTPFNFAQTADLSRQLVAMGIAADDVIPTMTDLGDAVSALGLGQEALARVAFNFGQIKTQGRLTGREMRDFAMNGIPVFDILQKKLGLNAEQMRRIGDQGISADVALKALREGLHERFGGAMEKQNKTLFGSFSNLQDAAQRAGAAIGGGFLAPLSVVVRALASALDLFNALPGPIKNAFGLALGVASVRLTMLSFTMARATLAAIAQTAANVNLAKSLVTVGDAAGQANKQSAFQRLGGFGRSAGNFLLSNPELIGLAAQQAVTPAVEKEAAKNTPRTKRPTDDFFNAINPILSLVGLGVTPIGKNGRPTTVIEDPLLAESKKQTDALNKIAGATEDKNGGFADSHLAPIAIQRSLTRRFAKQVRA